jgi:hypothetical protein
MRTSLLIILLAAGSALACVYYFPRTSRAGRWILTGLRIGIFLALAVALVEPVFTVQRFAARQNVIPVLIDVSESMRLFRPDSSVVPFLRSLNALQKDNSQKDLRFTLLCFGDSLRPCASAESLRFSDKQSILPSSFTEKQALLAPLCLIISDGHFSNTSLPRGPYQEKTCLYYTLGPVSPRPFLSPEILSVKDHVEADSPSVAVVHLQGFSEAQGSLQLICRVKSAVMSRQTVRTGSGFFSDTAVLPLPTSRQGRFLYTITITSSDNTMHRVLYFTQTVVPGRFIARLFPGVPSIDRRFLSLALKNDRQWIVTTGAEDKCDALFILDHPGAGPDAIKALEPRGIVVFLGTPDCNGMTAVSPVSFSLVTYQAGDSLFGQFTGADLPPPSRLFRCSVPFLSHPRPLLGCRVPDEAHGTGHGRLHDTIPFLSLGTFERHEAVAIAGQDLWRLDFWPLSAARQSESESFIQHVASFVKQQIVQNNTSGFLVYPSSSELFENDSVRLTLMLPSDPNARNFQQSGPYDPMASFIVDTLSKTVLSSGPLKIDMDDPFRGTVMLPPLSHGTYRYQCAIEFGGTRYEFHDTLHIDPNQEELSVPGQNTVLLNQIGLPLQQNSVRAVLEAYAAASTSKRDIVADTFELRKSWPLLAVILGFLTLEWLVRRRQNLE